MAVVAAVQVRVDAKNASQQLQTLDQRSKALTGGFKGASSGAAGLGAAIKSALGPILTVTTAVATLKKGLDTAFARGAAEKRLQNLTGSTREYQAALAVASNSAEKFGISQTDATKALADVFSRLKGVGFGLKETSEIYDGFNVIAKESGLSSEAASSAFFQLSQALGKGTLNGDEFVTVAEQMPQLLDKIATTTGASRGELREMASQGKITSKVLYEALSGAAESSGDLNGKLTDAAKAFNSLTRISDQLLNQLGKVFAPFVIKGAEALTWAAGKLSEWWDYLGKNVFPRVMRVLQPLLNELKKIWDSIPWDKIVAVWREFLLNAIELVIAQLQFVVPILTKIAQKIIEIGNSPAFQFLKDRIGDVINFLGLGGNKVTEFAERQKGMTAEAAKTVDQFSSMPTDIEKAAAAQKVLVDSIKEGVAQLEAQKSVINQQEAAFQNAVDVTSARLDAEREINSLHQKQLEIAYEEARTVEQRFQIAQRLYENEIQAAKIAYDQSVNAIEAARQTLEFKRQGAIIDGQILKARGEIAVLEAKGLEQKQAAQLQAQKALDSQMQAVRMIDQQIAAQNQVAQYQKQAAEAQFQSARLTAEQNLKQKLVSDEIGMSQSRANQLVSELRNSTSNAFDLNNGMGRVASNTQQTSYMMISVANNADAAANAIHRAADAQARLNAERAKSSSGGSAEGAAEGAYWPGGFKAFAKGGMVTGPTLGLIGEGGEPEYIIPQSKAAGFAANYLTGKRGADAIPAFAEGGFVAPPSANVNIQTGPVTQIDGVNYVTTKEMMVTMQKAIQQTLQLLRRDLSVRGRLGLS